MTDDLAAAAPAAATRSPRPPRPRRSKHNGFEISPQRAQVAGGGEEARGGASLFQCILGRPDLTCVAIVTALMEAACDFTQPIVTGVCQRKALVALSSALQQ